MKYTNENGRSMVEMLGVLAIVGVLSIGGIAGYTRAMRNWRANEIIDAANKVVVLAETEDDGKADYTDVGTIANVAGGALDTIEAERSGSTGTVTITLASATDAMKELGKTIREKVGDTASPRVLSGYTVVIYCGANASCEPPQTPPAGGS